MILIDLAYGISFFLPYRLAQFLVRFLHTRGVNFRIFIPCISAIPAVSWILGILGFKINSRIGPLALFVNIPLTVFTVYLIMACHYLRRKDSKMRGAIKDVQKDPSAGLLGINLVTLESITTADIDWFRHIEVGANEEVLQDLIPWFVRADARYHGSIIFIVPEGKAALFEEITSILKPKGKESASCPFFYYSSKNSSLSVSYSPFFGPSAYWVESWIGLENTKERELLDRLIALLRELEKPFDLQELLLLLKGRKAASVLAGESSGLQKYFAEFDSLRDLRIPLAAKLEAFGSELKLKKDSILRAFPLDVSNLLKSGANLYLEIEGEQSALTAFLLFDIQKRLHAELDGRHYSKAISKPLVYIIHLEQIGDKDRHVRKFIEGLGEIAFFRIFSTCPKFSDGSEWSTIIGPGAIRSADSEKIGKWSRDEMLNERMCLDLNGYFSSILEERTLEAADCLTRGMPIWKAHGFLRQGWSDGTTRSRYAHFAIFCRKPERQPYRPCENPYTKQQLLNLQQLVNTRSYRPGMDPAVSKILDDLKP